MTYLSLLSGVPLRHFIMSGCRGPLHPLATGVTPAWRDFCVTFFITAAVWRDLCVTSSSYQGGMTVSSAYDRRDLRVTISRLVTGVTFV